MNTPVREVSRDVIVKAAKKAIAQARAEGEIVSTSLARKLLRVARTNDRFLLGSWYLEGCGCLVGNLHPGINADMLPEAEYTVGVKFDHILASMRVWRDDIPVSTILQVA